MPSSRAIVTGEDYTADDINNLRDDVLAGHTHDGTDGAKVPFSNLDVSGTGGSAAPSGGIASYDDIDDHLAQSQDVHGLNAAVHVVGSDVAGTLIQGGTVNFTGSEAVIEFPLEYDSAPAVVANGYGSIAGIGEYLGIVIKEVSTTSATLSHGSNEPMVAFWMAIGTKAV